MNYEYVILLGVGIYFTLVIAAKLVELLTKEDV